MCRHRYHNADLPPAVAGNQPLDLPPAGLEGLFVKVPGNLNRSTSEALFRFYQKDNDRYMLEIVANTAAYFRVACKRVIDVVPMCIENNFFSRFAETLRESLANNLGVLTDSAGEICARFTVEEPDAEKNRERLTRMKTTILEGLKIIKQAATP